MTETDPGHAQPHAGEVGARRQEIGVHTSEGDKSLNMPWNVPDEPVTAPHSHTVETTAETAAGATAGTAAGITVRPGESELEAVRRDVEQTRRELGDTVEELLHRADVRARLKEKTGETAARIDRRVRGVVTGTRRHSGRTAVVVAAAGGAAALLLTARRMLSSGRRPRRRTIWVIRKR